MIDVKKAADISAEYLKQFFPEATKVQLEEVELTDDKKFWNITLSYEGDDLSTTSFVILNRQRKFKVFRVEADSGTVLSMKIRELK